MWLSFRIVRITIKKFVKLQAKLITHAKFAELQKTNGKLGFD